MIICVLGGELDLECGFQFGPRSQADLIYLHTFEMVAFAISADAVAQSTWRILIHVPSWSSGMAPNVSTFPLQ